MTAVLPPSICLQVKVAESEIDVIDLIADIDISEKEYLVIFVNNATKDTAGSHWSVLFYFRNENWFHHVDTIPGANETSAKIIYEKFSMALNLKKLHFYHL